MKKKRAPVFSSIVFLMVVSFFFLFPLAGLKIPQRDNPFYYRKKFGTATAVQQYQQLAAIDYGSTNANQMMEPNVQYTEKGFEQVNHGIRMDLDNYADLSC
jgi:hypothetical protein